MLVPGNRLAGGSYRNGSHTSTCEPPASVVLLEPAGSAATARKRWVSTTNRPGYGTIRSVTPEADTEQAFASQRFVWRKVKIAHPAGGQGTARRSRRSFLRLAPQPRTRPVRLTVTWRGGAEGWWFVEARGEHQAFPGHWCLEDVMARVLSER